LEEAMRRTQVLWEVFVTRFEEAFEQYRRHRLSGEEAGELLGMSGRNFRRLCVRYEEDGIEGLRDRRIGKASPRRAPERELERMHDLYRERYSDFTVKHFHEQLVRRHGYKLCYTVTRLSLQAAGLVAKAKRRGAHRKKRERRPLPGMLLFQSLPPRRRGTARRIVGSPASIAISTWWSHSTMPLGRSVRRFWWSRKARCRAFAGWPKRLPRTACLGRFIPTGARITS
jgi:hypothetical protein